jgi:hypothetical protein
VQYFSLHESTPTTNNLEIVSRSGRFFRVYPTLDPHFEQGLALRFGDIDHGSRQELDPGEL